MSKNVNNIKLAPNKYFSNSSILDNVIDNFSNYKNVLLLGNLAGFFGYYDETQQNYEDRINLLLSHKRVKMNSAKLARRMSDKSKKTYIVGNDYTIDYFKSIVNLYREKTLTQCRIDFNDLKNCVNELDRLFQICAKRKIMFDCVIMNPPYDKSLHLKILDKVVSACPNAEIVNLSPVRWLQDPLAEYKKSSDWKKYENIRNHISNIEVASAYEASKLFNSNQKQNIGIYFLSKNIIKKISCKNKIIDKIIKSGNVNIPLTKVKDCTKKYFILISSIVGDHNGFDNIFKNSSIIFNEKIYGKYYVDNKSEMNNLSISENKSLCKRSVHGSSENFNCVGFNTENEVKNFYNFVYTKLFKYVLLKTTVDVHIYSKFLPWMNDYTQEWTDQKLYKYFNLSKDEINEIESFKY